MKKVVKAFLEKYDEFGESKKAFEALGIFDYDKREKLINYCEKKGYMFRPRNDIVLEISEKGREELKE